MSKSRSSLPENQDWLIKRMQSLGYPSDKGGICFGIAYMGMLAILAKDTDTFDQRLADINNIPSERFAATIEKIKKNYLDSIHQIKKEFWKQYFPTTKEFDFTTLTVKQKKEFEKAWFEKLKELGNKKPSLLDIPIFFENIELAHNARYYSHLFNPNEIHKTQDAGLLLKSVSPQSLDDNVKKSHGVAGAFNKKELADHFNKLGFTCRQSPEVTEPIAMMISSINHTITVGYNPTKGQWFLIDANELPTCKVSVKDTELLAEKVVSAFSKNDNAIISIDIFTPKSVDLVQINYWLEDENLQMIENIAEKSQRTDSSGNSWLFLAVEQNNANLVESLLEEGANPNQANNKGVTPLAVAILQKNIEVIELLLEVGADVHYEDNKGRMPLLMSAQMGNIPIIEKLLDFVDLDEPNKNGVTAMHAAAELGQMEVIKLLLELGANVNAETNEGYSPLIVATRAGKLDAMELLLKEFTTDINHQAKDGSTALFIAAKEGDLDAVKLLLSQNANTTLSVVWNEEHLENFTDLDIITALEEVIKKKYPDFEVNTEIDEDETVAEKMFEFTPLEIAQIMGHKEIVNFLQEKTLVQHSSETVNNKNYSDLISAAKQGYLEVVKQLLDQQSDINNQSTDGSTALFMAAREGHLDIVKLLLEKGANPSLSATWDEEYMEEFAQLRDVEEAMSEVLSNKFGINDDEAEEMAVDTFKISPLEIVEIMGHKEIAQLLEAKLLQKLDESLLAKSESVLFFSQPKNDREISQSTKTCSPIKEETNYKKTG